MGGFLLIRKKRDTPVEQIDAQRQSSIDVFHRKGLRLEKKIVRPQFVLSLFHKYSFQLENVVEFDNDDFIASCGTAIFGGETGPTALRAIYEDFSKGRRSLKGLYGHYCLFIFHQGQLELFNDYTGIYRIYTDASKSILSSSFLAIARSMPRKTLSRQELYEYLFHGAFYGDDTIYREIKLLDSQKRWQVVPRVWAYPAGISLEKLPQKESFTKTVNAVVGALVDYFWMLKSAFGDSIAVSLSGGYDTRLMLALLKKVGISPYYFVYGTERSADVRIAKIVAAGEKVPLDHIDKSQFPRIDADRYRQLIERNFYLFDGFGIVGIFDNGSDIATRIDRTRRAHLQLNGGGGEIYRNFWHLANRSIGIQDFLKSNYDILDGTICRLGFDREGYFSSLQKKIKMILNIDRNWLTRVEAEMLYPFFRLKYWMGMNASIDNQFGYALTPFAEPVMAIPSFNIPLEYKFFGQFEAALIKKIRPSVAKYLSVYGHNFFDPIRWRVKFRETIQQNIPLTWRSVLSRTRRKLRRYPQPFFFQKKYLHELFGGEELLVNEYVHLERIKDPNMYSRALTLELVIRDVS